jgi:hypothetical protein
MTDQSDGRNFFHLFDRRSLAHVGAFQVVSALGLTDCSS